MHWTKLKLFETDTRLWRNSAKTICCLHWILMKFTVKSMLSLCDNPPRISIWCIILSSLSQAKLCVFLNACVHGLTNLFWKLQSFLNTLLCFWPVAYPYWTNKIVTKNVVVVPLVVFRTPVWKKITLHFRKLQLWAEKFFAPYWAKGPSRFWRVCQKNV